MTLSVPLLGEKVNSSIILDVALNLLPMYKELRDLVNEPDVKKLMESFENVDERLLKSDSQDKEVRALDFVKSLAPKYYQLTQAVPDAERNTQLDIVCKTNNELINIDIQLQPQNYWDIRILDHICGLFHRQFGRGFRWSELENGFIGWDIKVRRSIGISILEQAPTHPENVTRILPWYNAKPWAYDKLKRVYRLREDNDHNAIRPGLLFYDFNLQAFNILRARHGFGDCSESLIEWLDFLSGADKKSRAEVALVKSPIIQKAYSIIDDLPMDVEEQAEEFLKRQYNISHFVGEKMKEAAKEAKEEGREEGREENKIETARNMLLDNMPVDAVVKYTKLSISEVESIALKLKPR